MRALEDVEESSSKDNIASGLGGGCNTSEESNSMCNNKVQMLRKHVIEGELDETRNIASFKDYDNTPEPRNHAFDGGRGGSDVTKKRCYSDVSTVEVQSSKDN